MSLTPGARFGPYEILAALGAGGMGEVYRATDTNLKRSVAIKVLPASVAADPERLARFQREAEVLAALNHPHIAAIYGLERSSATTALVMELVEGEDLSQRIVRGAIPIDEALPIAKQVAEALEAAHEQGIIHRDLKPANIKVRADGVVKVLDFGLAKALEPSHDGGRAASPADSPTITSPAMMTGVGVILGTAAYMSPEQAKGRTVDRRADVWAFGAVFYEMLSGHRAFAGEDISDTLASVLKTEPDWSRLPADLPPRVRLAVRACLQKDPKQRLGDVQSVRLALDGAFETVLPGTAAPAPALQPRSLWRRAIPVVVAAVIAAAMVGAAAWTVWPPAPASPVTRFALALGEGQQFTNTGRQAVALSPDGTQMVYVANQRLYLRSLSALEARPIVGTEFTQGGVVNPVFSPDGRSVAFFADQTLKTIAVNGGTAVTICPASNPLGMSWDADGILFGQLGKGIMRVLANGGQPELLVSVKDGEVMYGPQLLPGGEWVIFTLATAATADGWDTAQIVAQSLKTSERKVLVSGGSDGRYLPTGRGSPKRGLLEGGLVVPRRAERDGGHLVYALGGVLFAVPFDLPRLTVTGGPVPIVEGVRRSTSVINRPGVAQFSVSSTGTLAFMPGPVSTSTVQMSVGLFDRKGGTELLKIPPGPYQTPRISPDGTRIAFGSEDGKEASILIYELSGTRAMRRLTFEGQGHNRFPVWSADSQRVAFQSDREGDLGIFWQRADGSGTAERLTKADEGTAHIPESWAPDGERLLYNAGVGGTSGTTELWVLSLKDRKAARFDRVQSPPTTLTGAVFSPDGRWVAYASREARTSSAVYVQPFPPTGAKYQISKTADDGHHPVWSSDGAELVFDPGPGSSLDAVRVTTQPSFTFTEATPVTQSFLQSVPAVERPWDISRDGQRFLGLIEAVPTQTGAPAASQIQVVLNWFEELRAKAPTK